MSRMKKSSTVIVGIDRLFLSVTNAVLNYVEAFKMQCGVSIAEIFVKDATTDMISLRYLLKRTHSSPVRYVNLGHL